MKLVELKCKNCGAQLKVEEGTAQVKCEFCGSTFSVDDAYNEGYKYTKGVLKAHSEQMEEDFNKAQDLMDSFISRFDSISIIASENGPKNIIRKIQKKKEAKSGKHQSNQRDNS